MYLPISGGLTAQVDWLGLSIGRHPALSLHSSDEPGELSQWLWSWWQHHFVMDVIIIIVIITLTSLLHRSDRYSKELVCYGRHMSTQNWWQMSACRQINGCADDHTQTQYCLLCRHFYFTALILLVGHQEEHPACKNWVMRCRCGYLSGVRCRLFAYGQLMPLPSRNSSPLTYFKSTLVLPFWYRLTQVLEEAVKPV